MTAPTITSLSVKGRTPKSVPLSIGRVAETRPKQWEVIRVWLHCVSRLMAMYNVVVLKRFIISALSKLLQLFQLLLQQRSPQHQELHQLQRLLQQHQQQLQQPQRRRQRLQKSHVWIHFDIIHLFFLFFTLYFLIRGRKTMFKITNLTKLHGCFMICNRSSFFHYSMWRCLYIKIGIHHTQALPIPISS